MNKRVKRTWLKLHKDVASKFLDLAVDNSETGQEMKKSGNHLGVNPAKVCKELKNWEFKMS